MILSKKDTVLSLDGIRKCVFCGRELAEHEECTCNKYKLVLRNFELICKAQEQINRYQQTIANLYDRMPEPAFGIREAIVALPSTPEPPAEDDGGENTEGGGEQWVV